MEISRFALLAAVAATVPATPTASAVRAEDPFAFFVGTTEMLSTVKVVMKKPYRARTVGRGSIGPDGALVLVQRVEDEGRPPATRRWHIRRTGPGNFTGTMSEAKGPVTVSQVGSRYRFRFKMKGSLSVEQWLTPLPGGKVAKSDSIVRKLGMKVATSNGIIRKIA